MQEYPKWVKVDGPGHPQMPGHVLVDNEDQERRVLAGEEAPRDLNPPHSAEADKRADEEKHINDMDRGELIAAIVKATITEDVTDEQLRDTLKSVREKEATDHANEGEGGRDPEPLKDAAGDRVPADPAEEANKIGDLGEDGRRLPEAKPTPGSDIRTEEAKAKEPDDKPAGNVTEAAATPPDHKRGARKPATDKAATDKAG